jgi:sialic acid synthase SpsE
MGGGNTARNDPAIIKQMIDLVDLVDTAEHEVILKWQLFTDAPPNIPMTHEAFDFAYHYAAKFGFETTSSVFDIESMRFLMGYDVPFVKIACRPELYGLAKYSTVPVYISSSGSLVDIPNATIMACIPKYPATIKEYEDRFTVEDLNIVSDHTVGWGLYLKYQPAIIEKHFVHERRADNPDAGPFAVDAKMLRMVL